MAVSGVILNGVSLSTCLSASHYVKVQSYVSVLFTCSLMNPSVCFLVSRGGVDPNQREDVSGNPHFLFLHLWSDDTGRACLLAEGLEEAAGGRLCPQLPVLRLQLVSVNFQNKCFWSVGLFRLFWSALWLARWYSESARWLVLKRRSDEALKTLHRVARINGKSEMIDKLTIEVSCPSLCTAGLVHTVYRDGW